MTTPEPRHVSNDGLIISEEKQGEENPFESLHTVMVFDPRDWSAYKRDAWVYGIVVGWDEEKPLKGETGREAMADLAAKFNWTDEDVARLRRLHKRFDEARASFKPKVVKR